MVNLATVNLKLIWRSRSWMDQPFGWVVEAETPFFFSSIWLLGILTFSMSGVLKWILTYFLVNSTIHSSGVNNWSVMNCIPLEQHLGFSGSSASKESACNAGDPGLILGLGRRE